MSGPFVYEMLFRGDASNAKAAAESVQAAINSLSSATKNAATAAVAETTALGENTAAKVRATQATQAQAAAETVARSAMLQAQGMAQTAMQRSIASWAGIREATESATAAELRHGMALDEIRASYNPLFAASRQYEMQLRGIAEAERKGAITASEAAAARTRAAASMAPIGPARGVQNPGGGANAFYSASLMAQWNDIAVMTAAGQNPMMLMMQQGTQVTQTFAAMRASGVGLGTALRSSFMGMLNPMSLATMAVIAFGSAAVQWMMNAHGETKTLKERMSDLASSTKEVESALKAAQMGGIQLFEVFGTGAERARKLNMALLDLATMKSMDKLLAAAGQMDDGLRRMMLDLEAVESYYTNSRADVLAEKYGLTYSQIQSVSVALAQLKKADGPDQVADAAQRLSDILRSASDESGKIPEALRAAAQTAAEAAIEALHLKGYSEQAAKLQEQLAKGSFAAPYTSAADEAKRLAEETMKILKDSASATKMHADLKAQAQLNEVILRFGENSIEVKRLKIELERQDFEAQLATLTITEQQRDVLRQQWELARGLKSADPFGSLAASREYLRTQQDSIAKSQLELGLIGQTAASRRRILALYEAELQIRDMHLDRNSEEATKLRQAAVAAAEAEANTNRVRDAWDEVQSAGEGAIDGIFEALKTGDVAGAVDSLASEIGSMFEQLAITNPLKNAIFGSDYATMNDIGGLSGIWDRLTGKAGPLEVSGISSKSVGAMTVTAAQVIINGSVSGLGASANLTGAPGALGGSTDVQSQVWNFFASKNLQPHQIAGIMGNISRESQFNPLAVGDGQTSFGLAQHHAGRADGLLSAVGGMGGLGNIQGQLDYIWQELLTSESGALKKLLASTNVQESTAAFAGFERPLGYSAANPMGADGWAERLGAAEAAMAKFGETAGLATGQLGNLGGGFDIFGRALSQIGQGGAAGGGGGFGSIIGSMLHDWGVPFFENGGRHSGGLRIVGENGPELEYTGPSTIVPADMTRRIMAGGAPANASVAPVIQLQPTLINNSSTPMKMEVQEVTDSRGQRQQKYVLSEAIASGLTAQGGAARRSLRDTYGLRPAGILR